MRQWPIAKRGIFLWSEKCKWTALTWSKPLGLKTAWQWSYSQQQREYKKRLFFPLFVSANRNVQFVCAEQKKSNMSVAPKPLTNTEQEWGIQILRNCCRHLCHSFTLFRLSFRLIYMSFLFPPFPPTSAPFWFYQPFFFFDFAITSVPPITYLFFFFHSLPFRPAHQKKKRFVRTKSRHVHFSCDCVRMTPEWKVGQRARMVGPRMSDQLS